MSYAEHVVKNFTNADELELSAHAPHGRCPAVVNLIQHIGSLRFQHGMRPDQARQMAAYLLELADVAETLQAEFDVAQAGR